MTLADKQVADVLMVSQLELEAFAYFLKGMAKRPVPNIMDQSGGKGRIGTSLIPLTCTDRLSDDLHELASGMEDPHAVSEA